MTHDKNHHCCDHDHDHDSAHHHHFHSQEARPEQSDSFEDSTQKELVYSKQVIEMITVANEYCLFIESAEKWNKQQILVYLQRLCPLMYLKGSLLPEVTLSNPEASERYVNEMQWEEVFLNLKNKLGEEDSFFSLDQNNEIVTLSIAEFIADIYQDMKDFVWLYQKDTFFPKQNAVYECRDLFHTNWGLKISGLMKALHQLLYKGNIEDSEPPLLDWED